MAVKKTEIRQLAKWIMIWVGSFFVAFYLRDHISSMFPDGQTQLIIGILLLLGAAYFFDLTKYGG